MSSAEWANSTLFYGLLESFQKPPWRPSADVYRTRNGWVVKYDLAGVRLEDVQLVVDGRLLTLAGVRRDCLTEEGCSHYQLEIAYSRFERTLEFPCALNMARVSTEQREGMLIVRIETGE